MDEITIKRSWRKTITLNVDKKGMILVHAPHWTPIRTIHQFISQHREWIERKRQSLTKKTMLQKRPFSQGDRIPFLGSALTITIGDYAHIKRQGEHLLIPSIVQFRINKEIETWCIQQSRTIIRDLVTSYAHTMNVSYQSISFSDTSSKWGSCTHDNKLQFNWRIVFAPIEVVQYLVVHELAHIVHKNHSRSFWETVRRAYPGYREQNRWLKKHGDTLTLHQYVKE